MLKTIKARYRNGLIEPLEKIDLADDVEITITISEAKDTSGDGLNKSFGGWEGLIDAEEFLRNIYADRRIATRERVRL